MHKKVAGIAAVVLSLAMFAGAAIAYDVPDFGKFLKVQDSLDKAYGTDGEPYINNESIYIPSAMQFVEEQSLGNLDQRFQYLTGHNSAYYYFSIQNKRSVYLLTPLPHSVRKNGKPVVIRNITVRLQMPVGVNITEVGVTNTSGYIYYSTLARRGTGMARDYVIDMGSRRAVPSEMQIFLTISNSLSTNRSVISYGARFLQEW